MTYIYKTKICVWAIAPRGSRWQLRWHLSDGFEISGDYSNPAQAADDVVQSATGFHEWDVAQHGAEIGDISNWQQVKSYP